MLLHSICDWLDSPKQPDLIQRGPVPAQGGCEYKRALVWYAFHWAADRPLPRCLGRCLPVHAETKGDGG